MQYIQPNNQIPVPPNTNFVILRINLWDLFPIFQPEETA